MLKSKEHIFSQLQKEILLLQGFKPASSEAHDTGLGIIQQLFPNANFPLGALHEFISSGQEESTASFGFIAGIISTLMKGSPSVWVSSSKKVFPPGLKVFGIDPHHFIFIQAKKSKEVLWVIEEALKTDGVSTVVGETSDLSFMESRRLQLAVEHSGVTGFLVRQNPKNLATASVARWKIKALPSQTAAIPGIGFPKWHVDLLKARNGKPGRWQVAWHNGRFELLQKPTIIYNEERRKVV